MKLFVAIILLLVVVIDAGLKEELITIWRRTKEAFKSAIPKTAKKIGDLIRNKIDRQTHIPFNMTRPIVGRKNFNFDAKTQAEMKGKLQHLGVFTSEDFDENCFNTGKQEKFLLNFYIPDVNTRNYPARLSVIGIEATKNEDNSVSVKSVELSARSMIMAIGKTHRRNVRESKNKQKERTQKYSSRELTNLEIKTLKNTLTKAIKEDPRYETIPGPHKEVDVTLFNETLHFYL
eukprot:gene14739-16362_t